MSVTTYDAGRIILAKLERRAGALENRVQSAERRLSSAERGKRTVDELLPTIGELAERLKTIEKHLGLSTPGTVDQAGDSQRSSDDGKLAARQAHDVASKIGAINRRNAEIWATKPGA